MSLRFIKIIKITSGGFHSWLEADLEGRIERIRKPNHKISEYLWDKFQGRESQLPMEILASEVDIKSEIKRSWWNRLISWFKRLIGFK